MLEFYTILAVMVEKGMFFRTWTPEKHVVYENVLEIKITLLGTPCKWKALLKKQLANKRFFSIAAIKDRPDSGDDSGEDSGDDDIYRPAIETGVFSTVLKFFSLLL